MLQEFVGKVRIRPSRRHLQVKGHQVLTTIGMIMVRGLEAHTNMPCSTTIDQTVVAIQLNLDPVIEHLTRYPQGQTPYHLDLDEWSSTAEVIVQLSIPNLIGPIIAPVPRQSMGDMTDRVRHPVNLLVIDAKSHPVVAPALGLGLLSGTLAGEAEIVILATSLMIGL